MQRLKRMANRRRLSYAQPSRVLSCASPRRNSKEKSKTRWPSILVAERRENMSLEYLQQYKSLLEGYPDDNPVAMDAVHANLIASVVLAKKPERILELGIGSGILTRALLAAIRVNRHGELESVDNLSDWRGEMPPHIR